MWRSTTAAPRSPCSAGTEPSATSRVLAGSDCRLAIVPAGTGNDFAKSVGVVRDVRTIAHGAAHGPDRLVDVGRAGDDVFLNAAGFGFDAAVIAETQRPTRLRGEAVYVAAALRELLGYEGFGAAVGDSAGPTRHERSASTSRLLQGRPLRT
jgi:diacylglycerol kinase family enzyme